MPTRETTPTGAPCWIDLQTSDADRARDFYTGLLGWEALESSAEFGGYWMFTQGGVPVAGGMPSDPQAPVRDVWAVYLSTPDATKTLEGAVEHGGQVVVPPMAVADMGSMGFLTDGAGGAGVGVWQADTFHGFGVLAEPGAPGWFELITRDYDRAVAFYRDVFGWQTQVMGDTPDFRYTVVIDPNAAEGADNQLAGVMDGSGFLPEGEPEVWSVYFAVADTDASAELVIELGGRIVDVPVDTPYGKMATAADPNGALFKLVGPNAAMPADSATS
jgi:hypothetical protein